MVLLQEAAPRRTSARLLARLNQVFSKQQVAATPCLLMLPYLGELRMERDIITKSSQSSH